MKNNKMLRSENTNNLGEREIDRYYCLVEKWEQHQILTRWGEYLLYSGGDSVKCIYISRESTRMGGLDASPLSRLRIG